MVAEPDAGDTAHDGREPTDEQQRLAQLDAIPPGAQVERSRDGSVTSVVTDDGWYISIDPESDLWAKMHRLADERGEDPAEYIDRALEAFLRGEIELDDLESTN
jgi:hypothetical protein